MASLLRHRGRAVARSLVDGLLVGGAEAALDLPARSGRRAAAYAGLLVVTGADSLADELPTLHQIARGLPPGPTPATDRVAALRAGLVSCGWGLLVTLGDGPAARALETRGLRHPHLLLGLLAGVATTVSTLPVWWKRATARAVADATSEDLDRELAELLGPPPD